MFALLTNAAFKMAIGYKIIYGDNSSVWFFLSTAFIHNYSEMTITNYGLYAAGMNSSYVRTSEWGWTKV